MITYDILGNPKLGSTVAKGSQNYMHSSGNGAIEIWYPVNYGYNNNAALSTLSVVASGIRAHPVITPHYPIYVTGIAINVTTGTAGAPFTSGVFAIYDSVMNNSTGGAAPMNLVWVSGPFECINTGIKVMNLYQRLEACSVYWFASVFSRAVTCRSSATYIPLAGFPNTLPATQNTVVQLAVTFNDGAFSSGLMPSGFGVPTYSATNDYPTIFFTARNGP